MRGEAILFLTARAFAAILKCMNINDSYVSAAQLGDLPEINKIYDSARRFMRESGNPTQWPEGYPSAASLAADIADNSLYLYKNKENILAVFKFYIGDDPTYRVIDGKWLNERPYGVIHRIAAADRGAGCATACISWCFERCKNLRIDTHADNAPMRRLLQKLGFSECGTIYIETGEPRTAFHKTLLGDKE